MSEKEKAKDLLRKMDVIYYMKLGGKNKDSKGFPVSMHKYQIKQCALICVDEILSAIDWHEFETPNKELEYWQKVKTEIENC